MLFGMYGRTRTLSTTAALLLLSCEKSVFCFSSGSSSSLSRRSWFTPTGSAGTSTTGRNTASSNSVVAQLVRGGGLSEFGCKSFPPRNPNRFVTVSSLLGTATSPTITQTTRTSSSLSATSATSNPATTMTTPAELGPSASDKLVALRSSLEEHSLDAYLVPSDDPHLSEYTPDAYKRRAFLTNFQGSAGTAVVTKSCALLWTDSRYVLCFGDDYAIVSVVNSDGYFYHTGNLVRHSFRLCIWICITRHLCHSLTTDISTKPIFRWILTTGLS